MFTFLISNLLKNNLKNPSSKVKNIVINEVISPTGASIADINDPDPIVTLPLVTEKATKFTSKN